MSQNKNLSRRDALKTLAAATGAVALTSLPGKWESPVVEVGSLPAHAQVSVLTISNLRGSFGQECGEGGISEILTFSYNDPTGQVNDDSTVNDFFEYLPLGPSGDDSLPITDSRVTHTGDGYMGTITVTYCAGFGGNTQIRETMSLTNGAGVTSNSLTITLDAPGGVLNPTGEGGAGYKR